MRHFKKILPAAAACILVLLFYRCPIKLFTGIPCPGCGMTRACLSALRLDFSSAFYYHPLWMLPGVFLLCFFFLKPKHPRIYGALVYVFIGLFMAAYLLRLWTGSPITAPDYTAGLVYRLLCRLKISSPLT